MALRQVFGDGYMVAWRKFDVAALHCIGAYQSEDQQLVGHRLFCAPAAGKVCDERFYILGADGTDRLVPKMVHCPLVCRFIPLERVLGQGGKVEVRPLVRNLPEQAAPLLPGGVLHDLVVNFPVGVSVEVDALPGSLVRPCGLQQAIRAAVGF